MSVLRLLNKQAQSIKNYFDKCNDMNKYIQRYNSTLLKYEIEYKQAQNIVLKNMDSQSLNRLLKLADRFMDLFPLCAQIIGEIKNKIDSSEYDKLSFEMINHISEMEQLIDEIEKIKACSVNYTEEFAKKTTEWAKDNEPKVVTNISSYSYFIGCNDIDSLNKRYRMLARAFHPDSGFGDKASFQKMNDEYEKCKNNIDKIVR